MEFTSTLVNLKSSVWSHGIIVPKDIAKQFIQINDKRVVCFFNGNVKLHAALLPKGKQTWFINVNKQIQKTLQLNEGDEVHVIIETDTSKYGMEAPEEFIELLNQDSEGNKLFEQLSMGKKRALLQIVLKFKNSQKRIEKSITIVEYLKDVNGQLDFKELNQALKNSRY